MLISYVILVGVVAAFWLWRLWSRDDRWAQRFTYEIATDPATLPALREPVPERYAGDPSPWPHVTVIVPGRNEGHVLAATLGSLCAMDYPDFRIVFVDDQSTDNTPAVCRELAARFPHLQVVTSTENPPAGWVGKPWAIRQGLAAAGLAAGPQAPADANQFVLFVDSDLIFAREALRQMVRLALHRHADLISLLPCTESHTLGEKLGIMAVLQLLALAHPLRKANDRRSKIALVAGGFLLFRLSAYRALGGHEAVQGQMIEDLAFGTLAKRKGMGVYTVATHDLMRGRMYEGWGDTFAGLKKNAYAAANYRVSIAVAFLLGLTIFAVLVPAYLLFSVWLWITRPSLWTFAALACGAVAWGAMLGVQTRTNRWLRLPDWLAWLAPAAAAFFGLAFLGSMRDYYRGGNDWSGRKYRGKDVQKLEGLDKG